MGGFIPPVGEKGEAEPLAGGFLCEAAVVALGAEQTLVERPGLLLGLGLCVVNTSAARGS